MASRELFVVSYVPGRRPRRAAAVMLSMAVLVVLAFFDASVRSSRNASETSSRRATVRTLGFADFALSSSARWLRHPSQVERMAPFQDLPASFDTDPAGALQGPPEP